MPPKPDEMEVSVFGPSRGECIVVRLPNGPWIVVDSLVVKTPSGNSPVAVEYLRRMGVSDVVGVFITHWHDDHTRGAADVLRAFAPSLKYVGLPAGFNERELASFAIDLLPDKHRFKLVQGLTDVITALAEPALQSVQRTILVDRVSFPLGGFSLEALSPSFDDVRYQAATLLSCLPEWRGPPPRRYDVNSGCAVLRVNCPPLAVILYSDLDIGENSTRGLQCIVGKYGTSLRAPIIKVGHHGSETAYYPPALAAGDASNAVGAITPFPARGEHLPRKKYVAIYKKVLRALHVTASPQKNPKNAGKVALKDTPFSAYARTSPRHLDAVGQVRYRVSSADAIVHVERFAGAISA